MIKNCICADDRNVCVIVLCWMLGMSLISFWYCIFRPATIVHLYSVLFAACFFLVCAIVLVVGLFYSYYG